jgi:hypothetical protein
MKSLHTIALVLAMPGIPKVEPIEGLIVGVCLFGLCILIVWLAWTKRIPWP